MALADRLGVPPQMVGDVIGSSSGTSFILGAQARGAPDNSGLLALLEPRPDASPPATSV